MRISDWSSDVCSSDLPDLAALIQVFRGDAEAPGGNLLDRRVLVVAVVARHEARGILAALAGIRLRAHAVHRNVECAVRLRRQRTKRHAGRDEALADRSEEHTSELQSLMRISYAVFCLKKKKKNKTTN